jgi:hypothetical protein
MCISSLLDTSLVLAHHRRIVAGVGRRLLGYTEHIMTTGSWDKNLPSASRFTILTEFNNEVVRDKNAGLVWEGLPGPTTRF